MTQLRTDTPDTKNMQEKRSFTDQLESIILSKNPVSILFGLARLREQFEDLADDLLSGIEKTYYEESFGQFGEVIALYEKHGFYKVMHAYHQNRGIRIFQDQKSKLDSYFEESYWKDPDFYFFVLERHPDIRLQFEAIRLVFQNQKYLQGCLNLPASQKGEFLQRLLEESGEKGILGKTQEVQRFFDVLLPKIPLLCQSSWCGLDGSKAQARRIMRDIYFLMLSDGTQASREFWKDAFIQNAPIRSYLLDSLEDYQVAECFKFLRTKLLKTPKYNLALSDSSAYRILIDEADALQSASGSADEKLQFIARVHGMMGIDSIRREQFQNVFRKGLMYRGALDLVDATLGIAFLGRISFYEVKRRMMPADMKEYVFESLQEVHRLIQLLDESIILRFFKPFFMRRLAAVFNKRADYYYFIKFILTIHGTKTYNEYVRLSQFFLSLEAYERKDFFWKLLVGVQFWWVALAGLLLFALAPFGVVLAIGGYGILRLTRRFLHQKWPELVLASNFQFGSFLFAFAVIACTFALTFWFQDNRAIVYSNYRSFINASTLIASETIAQLRFVDWLKANVLEEGSKKGEGSIFSEMNYLEGEWYMQVHSKLQGVTQPK